MDTKPWAAFLADEDGGITIMGLLFFATNLAIGGLALDYSNAVQAQARLQVAADAAAHAALFTRELNSEAIAKDIALQVAEANMPDEAFGTVLTSADIVFGVWDPEAFTFTAEAGSRDAVQVSTRRIAERNNSVSTYLLRLVGLDEWTLNTPSVFTTYFPTCFQEGFVAESVVDVQTDNLYRSGFCIHSNTYVEVNSNNTFESGVVVSMPDKRDLVLPSDGFATNTGLEAALRDGSYELRILNRVNDIISGVKTPSSPYYRDYITSSTPIAVNRNDKLDATKFTAGRIHEIDCTSSSQQAKIHAGTRLTQVVISTDCQLMFGENVVLEDVVIVNTNTSAGSFSGASGVQLGRNDNCSEGGGAQLVTAGGINIPQYLKMFGGQMIGVGNISFTSDANGTQGASVISGGTISGTTDMVMGVCNGAGMEDNFEAPYFRLAY